MLLIKLITNKTKTEKMTLLGFLKKKITAKAKIQIFDFCVKNSKSNYYSLLENKVLMNP